MSISDSADDEEEGKLEGDTKPMSEIGNEFDNKDELEDYWDSDDYDEEEIIDKDEDNDWIIPITLRQIRNEEPTACTDYMIKIDGIIHQSPPVHSRELTEVTNWTETSRIVCG